MAMEAMRGRVLVVVRVESKSRKRRRGWGRWGGILWGGVGVCLVFVSCSWGFFGLFGGKWGYGFFTEKKKKGGGGEGRGGGASKRCGRRGREVCMHEKTIREGNKYENK